MRRIDELHLDYPFAGSRMLRDMLGREGVAIGRRRVATTMKRMGIKAIYRRPNTSKLALIGVRMPSSTASPAPSSTRKKLVELMNFRTNLFLGFQGHYDQLTILRRVKHVTKILVRDSHAPDILHEAFHDETSIVN
jgi:hypothetical protein